LSPETSVVEGARRMISNKTRLLVYESATLVGMITTSDLAKALLKTTEGNLSLEKVMSRNVFILEAARQFLK
jgi:predicted transcriptional regulator